MPCACSVLLSSFSTRLQTSLSRESTKSFIMPFSQVRLISSGRETRTLLTLFRIPFLLSCGCHFLNRHDLPGSTGIRKEKPPHLHLDLLDRWLRLRHVGQSLWHCLETYPRRQQPVHSTLHLRLCHRYGILHPDADELFQQGIEPIFNVHVSGRRGEMEQRLFL